MLAALSTLYDFIWAHFEVRHRVVNGLVHGMTLLSVAGLVFGWGARRPTAGIVGGAAAGLVAAASFYALFPLLGYLGGIIGAWMLLWLLFAALDAWLRRQPVRSREVVARGAIAALLSGVAFYLVSGMWTDPQQPELPAELRVLDLRVLPGLRGNPGAPATAVVRARPN